MHNESSGIEIKDKHCKAIEFSVSSHMFVSLEFSSRATGKDAENGSFLFVYFTT